MQKSKREAEARKREAEEKEREKKAHEKKAREEQERKDNEARQKREAEEKRKAEEKSKREAEKKALQELEEKERIEAEKKASDAFQQDKQELLLDLKELNTKGILKFIKIFNTQIRLNYIIESCFKFLSDFKFHKSTRYSKFVKNNPIKHNQKR